MSMRRVFVCAASVAVNLALVAWGRGAIGQIIVISILVQLAFVALFVGFFMRVAPAGVWRHAWPVIAVGVIAGSCLISLPIGSLVNRYEMTRARQFCDGLRPGLDRFRRSNGRYPGQLSELPIKVQPPWLLDGTEFYHLEGAGSGYRFSFVDPSRFLAGYDFDSRRGTWDYWD